MSDIVEDIIEKLKEDMLASPVDDVTIISRQQLETLEAEITRLRAALADERKRALEEAAKALDAWGDIYGDNAAETVRALKEPTK
jgi:hypothetical protein